MPHDFTSNNSIMDVEADNMGNMGNWQGGHHSTKQPIYVNTG